MGANFSKHLVHTPRINFLEGGYRPVESFGECGCGVEAVLGDGLCVVCWDALSTRSLPFFTKQSAQFRLVTVNRAVGTVKGMNQFRAKERRLRQAAEVQKHIIQDAAVLNLSVKIHESSG